MTSVSSLFERIPLMRPLAQLMRGGDLCGDCARRCNELTWRSPDDLWQQVTGQYWQFSEGHGCWYYMDETGVHFADESTAGVVRHLCPRCFARRADEAGVPVVWMPVPFPALA